MVLWLLPLYKIWGGTSFFVFQTRWDTRAKNYEIHSYYDSFYLYPSIMFYGIIRIGRLNIKNMRVGYVIVIKVIKSGG